MGYKIAVSGIILTCGINIYLYTCPGEYTFGLLVNLKIENNAIRWGFRFQAQFWHVRISAISDSRQKPRFERFHSCPKNEAKGQRNEVSLFEVAVSERRKSKAGAVFIVNNGGTCQPSFSIPPIGRNKRRSIYASWFLLHQSYIPVRQHWNMEVNDQNLGQVQALMLQALSSDNTARREGRKKSLTMFNSTSSLSCRSPLDSNLPCLFSLIYSCTSHCSGGDD